jgi:glycosyltransferase involved in cell wall biosynthesis
MPTVALIGAELFPIPPLRGGAAELFIEQVAARLQKWRPVVISRCDPELPEHEHRGQVEYFRVPLSGWRFRLYKRYRQLFPLYDRRVYDIIERLKPDLVHVHNRPLLALYLQKHLHDRIPVILHLHNLYNSLGKRERPPLGRSMPVAACVACSRFVLDRERTRLGLGAKSHWVVYNGVDPTRFFCRGQHPETTKVFRQRYGLADEPTVLFVGKIRESKGVGLLLPAMECVWRRLPQAVLILAGGTEYGQGRTDRPTPFYRRLQQELQRAGGRVILTGFIPPAAIASIYQLGDIFVGPSQIEEGLGMVFLEASASGLPIIATRRGGIPEVVHSGMNGLLLERHDDPQELANAIVQLLLDKSLQESLGRQGCQWVRDNFTWETIARRQAQVYDAVLAQSAAFNQDGNNSVA